MKYYELFHLVQNKTETNLHLNYNGKIVKNFHSFSSEKLKFVDLDIVF